MPKGGETGALAAWYDMATGQSQTTSIWETAAVCSEDDGALALKCAVAIVFVKLR